ncbi:MULTISPECIES: YitT family protein [Vibrio]|uniref:YitT family protein n=1 Tax=Vibrio casei TaxID=673372 RepID=A0A368LPJ6_9VIBR|nr:MULTISPECIES: YitT family protein [Vibrio]RCS73758.1 YitT family protein [Vibrio casei]HBV77348.1 YitT family protein [Vibrio sp.]
MEKHSKKEDGIALIVGSFMVALGVFFLSSAQLLTGGTAGLALLLSQLSLLSFGTLYFFINLPFYALAWQRFGRQFAMNSLLSGALVSLFADNLHYVIQFNLINDLFCAVAGGLLIGIGMLILFRHRSSLGGFNVMCLLIQDRTGISVGKTQLILDCSIVLASLLFVSGWIIALSILGAIILNITLTMNHKPARYTVRYQP